MENYEIGEVFTISDMDNEDQEVEVVGIISEADGDYIAVSFVEDLQQGKEEDIDVFYLKVEQDGFLSEIESDEEFDKISAAFDAMMNQK